MPPIALETIHCPLCGARAFTLRGRLCDIALGVPLKLGLEVTLPLARGLGLGEVVRYSIVRA